MAEDSELMTILRRRKHLSEIEDNDIDDDDGVVMCDARNHTENANTLGGQLYKIIRHNEGGHTSDIDQETNQDEESVTYRRSTLSHLYRWQPSRESYSSLNSRLSALSNSLQSSFSSTSDNGDVLSIRNAVKLRPKDSILVNSNRQRRKLVQRLNSAPIESAEIVDASLWSRGTSICEKLHKTNSSTSLESDTSDEHMYFSIDGSIDRSYEELSKYVDSNNISTKTIEKSEENIYESIEHIGSLRISGSNEDNHEYSDITIKQDFDDEVQVRKCKSRVKFTDNNLDYGSDSNEFGFEHYDNYHSGKKLVSAINKHVKSGEGYSVDPAVFAQDDDPSDHEEADSAATVISDEYGSDHYEDVESGLNVITTINECFQNEGIIFEGVPSDTKFDKYQRRLRGRVNELLQTELAFVSKLDHVVNDYKAELKGDGIPLSLSCLLPDHIFSNVEDLRDFHKEVFLPALQDADHNLIAIGKVFKDNEIPFRMYIRYSRDNKKCIRNVIEHKHFFHIRQTELGQRLDLSSYLLEPIQRVPRYRLFLDDLIKTCQKQEEETREDSGIGIGCRSSIASYGSSIFYDNINFEEEPPIMFKEETGLESLQSAKNMIDKLLRKIDDTVAIENVRGSPISLREQGELLRQDEFIVIDNTKRRLQMRCFLFENMIVFTTVNRKHVQDEVFEFHDYIEMKDLGLTPPPEEECHSTFTVWYKKRNNKPYIMDGTANIKKTWVKDISALLWEQARRDKEMLINSVSRKSSLVSSTSKVLEESNDPIEADYVILPVKVQTAASRMAGDQCTSDRKTITKRKLRKKKVKTDFPDTLTYVGRNMNVLWASLR